MTIHWGCSGVEVVERQISSASECLIIKDSASLPERTERPRTSLGAADWVAKALDVHGIGLGQSGHSVFKRIDWPAGGTGGPFSCQVGRFVQWIVQSKAATRPYLRPYFSPSYPGVNCQRR